MHPTVRTAQLRNINWAEVASKAKADLGDERVEHASARLRMAMLAVADSARPASDWGRRDKQRAGHAESNT